MLGQLVDTRWDYSGDTRYNSQLQALIFVLASTNAELEIRVQWLRIQRVSPIWTGTN